MSELESGGNSPRKRVGRSIRRGFLVVLILFVGLFLLTMVGGSGLIDAGFSLLLGWVAFLQRTLPRTAWNFDLIAMGALCVAVALFLAHSFLDWMTRSISKSRGPGWCWRWKWTWCGVCGVGLLFLVGMAVGGVAHQIGWIASSPEPLMERKGKNYAVRGALLNLEAGFRVAMGEANDNLAVARQAMWNPQSGVLGNPDKSLALLQAVHFLLILDEAKAMQGYILFPRDPKQSKAWGGYFCAGENHEWVDAEKLTQLLQQYREQLEPL